MPVAARARLGQWFTPPHVAQLALSLAAEGADRARARVLDPACGDGAFLAAAAARGFASAHLHGVDIDPEAASACRARVPGASVRTGDLFDREAPRRGYDVVVGNPPYVRSERIDPAVKRARRARLQADWPEAAPALLDRVAGRGDLAAACVLRALRWARPGARVALVVSSALLDAAYADSLWRLVATAGRVVALVDAPGERWFPDAAVNALIVVIERGVAHEAPVTVARLNVPTAVAARRVAGLDDLHAVAELRQVAADRPGRWSVAVRAEAAWFDFEASAEPWLVRLGDVADVRRGITSGANDIFYLPRARAAELEASALTPLVRAPDRAASIAVDPATTPYVLVSAPADLTATPRLAAHLASFPGAASRSTLRARRPWWVVPVRPARLFLTKAYAARFVQRMAPRPVACDQRVYAVEPRAGVGLEALAAVLNASTTAFALESLGRASMGEGALEWSVADARDLPVLDPRRVDPAPLRAMQGRSIDSVDREADRADRAALDRAAADPSLHALLPEVRAALCRAVARRADRARSA